jgi:hypothetical protein
VSLWRPTASSPSSGPVKVEETPTAFSCSDISPAACATAARCWSIRLGKAINRRRWPLGRGLEWERHRRSSGRFLSTVPSERSKRWIRDASQFEAARRAGASRYRSRRKRRGLIGMEWRWSARRGGHLLATVRRARRHGRPRRADQHRRPRTANPSVAGRRRRWIVPGRLGRLAERLGKAADDADFFRASEYRRGNLQRRGRRLFSNRSSNRGKPQRRRAATSVRPTTDSGPNGVQRHGRRVLRRPRRRAHGLGRILESRADYCSTSRRGRIEGRRGVSGQSTCQGRQNACARRVERRRRRDRGVEWNRLRRPNGNLWPGVPGRSRPSAAADHRRSRCGYRRIGRRPDHGQHRDSRPGRRRQSHRQP